MTLEEQRIEELELEVQRLTRRLTGHQEAIVRWRRKAGVEPPVEELELFKDEVFSYRGEFINKQYYTMPIEKSPFLLAEAWAWVLENNLENITERVHFDKFDQKRGWVLTLAKTWKSDSL